MTMTPKGIDFQAWEQGRVPPDVKQAITFIYICTHQKQSVTWAQIAEFMNWNVPREELRAKMKRLRRWGVRWDLNKKHSTRVDRKVWPYIQEEIRRDSEHLRQARK